MSLTAHLVYNGISGLFLLLFTFRLWELRTENSKLVPNLRGHLKIAIGVGLLILQLVGLVSRRSLATQFDFGDAAAITSLVISIGLLPLLFLEHTRSIKPSDLIVVYLLTSLLFDSGELGTLVSSNERLSSLFSVTARLLTRFLLLVIESQGKEKILRGNKQRSPEQAAGILNRTFFRWINSVLAQGSGETLTANSLPPID